MIHRKNQFFPTQSKSFQNFFGQMNFVFFHQRISDGNFLSRQKRVSHGAANDKTVDFFQQVFDDVDFIADFGSAQQTQKRFFCIVQKSIQNLDFFLNQKPDAFHFDKTWESLNSAVGSVNGSERVVDVHVSK